MAPLGEEGQQHAASVDAWLASAAKGLSAEELLRLLDAAFGALWQRTRTTLGEVTLTAIADRVLHNAAEAFPAFSALEVEPASGIRFGSLAAQCGEAPVAELRAGLRMVLVEFLTVLGNLTAELLTVELHSLLGGVTLEGAPNAAARSADQGRAR